jgi:hypothetical protein
MSGTVTLKGVWLGGRLRPDMGGMVEAQADIPEERQAIGVAGLHGSFPLSAETFAKLPPLGTKVTITVSWE